MFKLPPFSKSKQRPVDPKEEILRHWRGVNVAELERERSLSAKPLADLIPRVLDSYGINRRRADVEIMRVWHHLIDPNIVAHAQPTGLRKGTLFVSVDSSVWLNEIVRYRYKEILDRLQHSFGKDIITRISFRVG